MLGAHRGEWLAERLGELDAGDTGAITAAARQFPLAGTKAEALDTALGYFENNAHRMRYQHFRSLGMFVGSGAVEAGCKAVIGQRLKLSGMHWSCSGATGILTLRCQQASNRWEEIWQQPATRHERPDPVSDNGPHSDHRGQTRLPASHLHSCPAHCLTQIAREYANID